MKVVYKKLHRDDIKLFDQIVRTETITHSYKVIDGKLIKVRDNVDIPDWSESQIRNKIQRLKEIFDNKGLIFGAFYENSLIGLSSLGYRWMGSNMKQLNLDGLWVSKDFRGRGVATRLLDLVQEEATNLGATSLYVSATQSANTVDFYRNRGFNLVEIPDKMLFEKEPNDIHMAMTILN